MKWSVFLIAFVLSGCVNTKLVPVYMMPTAPAALLTPLPPLQIIQKPGSENDNTE